MWCGVWYFPQYRPDMSSLLFLGVFRQVDAPAPGMQGYSFRVFRFNNGICAVFGTDAPVALHEHDVSQVMLHDVFPRILSWHPIFHNTSNVSVSLGMSDLVSDFGDRGQPALLCRCGSTAATEGTVLIAVMVPANERLRGGTPLVAVMVPVSDQRRPGLYPNPRRR